MAIYLQKIKRVISRYKLAFTISGAISVTLLLTITSVALYNITGSAKLDLSRPGYSEAIKQLKKTDNSSSSFKSDGPITSSVIKHYLLSYQKLQLDLHSYDNFDQTLLDDTHLGLNQQQTAPSDGARQP